MNDENAVQVLDVFVLDGRSQGQWTAEKGTSELHVVINLQRHS